MQDKNFDRPYVMQVTLRHLHETIDFSSRKTWDRFKDFQDDPEKKAEIFETLGILNKLHSLIDEFKTNNITLFEKGD